MTEDKLVRILDETIGDRMSYGERTEAVLSVLKENPGIFKHQIAAKLGLLSKDISGAMSALQGRDRIVQREGLYYLKENESKK